ncbi:MAG: hypothetical protein ACYDCQ_00340 [Dehalococcoidia bacterium]
MAMVREAAPIDISDMPEVTDLVDEVQHTGRPRMLSHNKKSVAILVPAVRTASPRPVRTPDDPLAVVEQTAGIFRSAGRTPPATPAEEKAAFAQSVAEEVMWHAEP